MTKQDFPIGVAVEGVDGDHGVVIEANGADARHPMACDDNVLVAWDSGVRTWTPASDLRTK